MTRIAWFHPFSGIAGDMTLAALVDAGVDPGGVEELLRRLPVGGWSLRWSEVVRGGLRGTHVAVDCPQEHHHRRCGDIVAMIDAAGYPDRLRRRAVVVFEALAVAEGHLHGKAPEEVTFHEVGAVDSIVDIVGVCAALELAGIDEIASGPVSVGTGLVRTAHGMLPNPPPAVVELLTGRPVRGVDVTLELTTPTGAAILAALAEDRFGPMPAMTILASGYGAGSKDLLGRANVLQVVLGERTPTAAPTAPAAPTQQAIVLLETTVDDVTGEVLGALVERLLDAGALDAWLAPVTMKKGRPGHVVTAVAAPATMSAVRDVLAAETGSLGIRQVPLDRWVAPRTFAAVVLDGQRIGLKVGPHRAKAEHDDVVAAAIALRRPIREVAAAAEARYLEDSLRQSDR